jgi:3'(2'), 5'-bisphosphate nucleotidase
MSSDDHSLAAELANGAGEVLLALRADQGFADQRALRDAGDRSAHEYLMAELARARPGDAVLSEEGKDDKRRLSADRVWIVDPLDGTREYGEEGRDDWAVHVALWERGGNDGGLTAGAVALPARGTTLDTGGPLPLPAPAGMRVAVSRTRPPALVDALVGWLGERGVEATLVPMGSAGVKITAVLRGEVDAYVHAGGQYEWDSAAPVALVRAAGAHASRIDGSELLYNRDDVLLPDLLVCLPELASVLLEGIKAVS